MSAQGAPYQARPGSTGDLVLRHLQAHGPTGELALAAAIDKEVGELGGLLTWPIGKGAIRKEIVGDEWVYSLGDGEPVGETKAAASETPAGPLIKVPRSSPAREAPANENTPQGDNRDASAGQSHGAGGSESPAGRGTNGAPALGASPVLSSSPLPPSSPVEKQEARAGLRGSNAALWLTGELAFEADDGTVIVFEPALVRCIAKFLLPIFEGQPA